MSRAGHDANDLASYGGACVSHWWDGVQHDQSINTRTNLKGVEESGIESIELNAQYR